MKLYDSPISGNCHKVWLLLSMLGLDYQSVPVDLAAGEQMRPEFLALNPLHKVPVLDDDGFVVRDSQAILIYLARRQDAVDWLPTEAREEAEVMQWMMFSANEMIHGPARARAILRFKRAGDLARTQDLARDALAILDGRLGDRDWLALGRPTIADLACYPYAGLVEEGEVSLEPYAAVLAWCDRVAALPGWVGMTGLAQA